MPLYMDHHKNVEGLSAKAVAEAHEKDLEVQDKHGVKYHRYWYNEDTGDVFCSPKLRTRKRPRPSTAKRMASLQTR